jgi:hypothetical protein
MSSALLPAFASAALLLTIAGAAKIASPYLAQASLSGAGIRLPRALVRVLGAAEVSVGAAAILAPNTITALAAALAYAGFCAFIVRLLRAEGGGLCGCFGGAGSEASPVHLALNAAALAVCAVAAASPPHGPDWVFARDPLVAVAICIGVGAATYASYVLFTAFPRAWRSYGSGEAS